MESAGHFPVLLPEVLEQLQPSARAWIVDCTVGLGGHAEALLERSGEQARLIGVDLDESNLLSTKERLRRFGGRVRLFQANYSDLDQVLAEVGIDRVDALLADLGVSSTQLDQPERGFSFQADGPLDMRMRREGPTAADLVNQASEKELADLIWRYGEERYSRRIARAIAAARVHGRIERTAELSRIVASAVPRRGAEKIHPATRTFQAIRIAVNSELESLERLLELVPRVLGVGGRAAIISFHSLEDRLVKQAFADAARSGLGKLLTSKPLQAAPHELAVNPRSRSAKLRALERIR